MAMGAGILISTFIIEPQNNCPPMDRRAVWCFYMKSSGQYRILGHENLKSLDEFLQPLGDDTVTGIVKMQAVGGVGIEVGRLVGFNA